MTDTLRMSWTVVSDVSDGHDGIGIEVFLDNDLALEIFRDDTKKTRELTLHKENVPLDFVEQSIAVFREKIPWEFLD